MATSTLTRMILRARNAGLTGLVRALVPTRIEQFLYQATEVPPSDNTIDGMDFTHHDSNSLTGDAELDNLVSRTREIFLARVDDRVIHRSSLYFDVLLPLQFGYADAPVISGCFTEPEYRGRGIYPTMLRHITAHVLSNGICQRLYVQVDVDNAPSIRGIEKAGFVRIARLSGVRVFGFVCCKRREVFGSNPVLGS